MGTDVLGMFLRGIRGRQGLVSSCFDVDLEHVVVEFCCAKTSLEDECIFDLSYDILEGIADRKQLMAAEKNDDVDEAVLRRFDPECTRHDSKP